MRGLVLTLGLLLPGLSPAFERYAVLGCPREDGAVTELSGMLVERVASRETGRSEGRRVDSETVVQVLQGQRLRGGEVLSAAQALKLGSYLEADRLIASSYRIDSGRCIVRWRAYETLTGSLERTDSLELLTDSVLLRLDAAIRSPAPEIVTDSVMRAATPVGLRIGQGAAPLVLDGCGFGETGARCRGWLRSAKGGEFRLLREGSRFAYDNGLRGPLGSWAVGGTVGSGRISPDDTVAVEFEVGISLAHSGPREFHYFQLRYQLGEELWEWKGIPPVLRK